MLGLVGLFQGQYPQLDSNTQIIIHASYLLTDNCDKLRYVYVHCRKEDLLQMRAVTANELATVLICAVVSSFFCTPILLLKLAAGHLLHPRMNLARGCTTPHTRTLIAAEYSRLPHASSVFRCTPLRCLSVPNLDPTCGKAYPCGAYPTKSRTTPS